MATKRKASTKKLSPKETGSGATVVQEGQVTTPPFTRDQYLQLDRESQQKQDKKLQNARDELEKKIDGRFLNHEKYLHDYPRDLNRYIATILITVTVGAGILLIASGYIKYIIEQNSEEAIKKIFSEKSMIYTPEGTNSGKLKLKNL